jgi:3-phosphoshikimate 1-carboxyvinyltransferase
MKLFGIRYSWEENEILIEEQNYKPVHYSVEADWSGASYWYAMVALSEQCDLLLEGLQLKSLQGDANQADWFRDYFGVQSSQESKGVRLTKLQASKTELLTLDFIENPDIAQTLAVLCVCKSLPFHFKGLQTLKIKETDRISALQAELSKMGAILTEPQPGELGWDGKINSELKEQSPSIKTYHDHRMALAFAPAALVLNSIRIEDPMVVTKSYPSFYEDLKKVGFVIS